jgi:hypothetical protein
VVRIPNWLGAQEHSRPLCVSLVSVVESTSSTEITDFLAAPMGIRKEFSGDSRQPTQGAHRRASYDHHPAAAYEANDRVSRRGKPKLDSGI